MKYLILITLLFCSCFSSFGQTDDMKIFIDELIGKMTIQEKIGQLNLLTPGGGIPTGAAVSSNVEEKIKNGKVGGVFGVTGPDKVRLAQEIAVKNSRLGIPMLFGSDVIHGYKTIFPIPIGVSCTWDMELVEKSARIAAVEASADGLCWNFSPMVDISRDPRWGRVSEGSGEDSFLGSEIAKAMVRGYQGDNLKSNNTLMATVKHFALYGASEAGRDYNTVDMSRQRMFNEYLEPYKAAVDAGVGCVMSSFNDVDAIPATANKWLLTDILRDKWSFDGFVVSDYTSVNEMIEHGLGDLQQVSALALKAGLDMDMVGEGFLTTLEKSLNEGLISENDINTACRRVLEAKYKLGLFENPFLYIDETLPEKEILTVENRKAAREIAAKSFVLLKNENQALPLSKTSKIALIGPLANNKNNMLGTWAVSGNPELSIPVLDGFVNVGGNSQMIKYAKGANISNDKDFAAKINVFGTRIDIDERTPEVLLKEAVKLAKKADVVVAVVGEASEMSGESSSRSDIGLPECQKILLRELSKTGKPLVVVMMSGRPLTIADELELADALLFVWHPGIEAGNAIADVIFGEQNPSGKLSTTFPRNAGQIPVYYNHKNTGRPAASDKFEKFRSNYLDVENSPLLPFGYGLSYTTFVYKNLKLSADEIDRHSKIVISVEIENTGNFDGEEVVQLYIQDVVASITRPVKELKGFKKLMIKKGETRKTEFEISEKDLRFYDNNLNNISEPGDFNVFVGTNSANYIKGSFKLK